jgi:hypothetical protein
MQHLGSCRARRRPSTLGAGSPRVRSPDGVSPTPARLPVEVASCAPASLVSWVVGDVGTSSTDTTTAHGSHRPWAVLCRSGTLGENDTAPDRGFAGQGLFVDLVGDTGIEPVTSSVSGKRATAAPIAQVLTCVEVGTGFEPVYTDLQSVASPLGQPTAGGPPGRDPVERPLRADNETRTRDLNLGKVALYQLSYVRLRFPSGDPAGSASGTLADGAAGAKTGSPTACSRAVRRGPRCLE